MVDIWHPAPPQGLSEQTKSRLLHIAAPSFVVMAANAILMLGGGGADLPAFDGVAHAPPAWVSAALWIALLVLVGLARHEVARSADPETLAVDALLVAMMVYPFTATAFGAYWVVANTLTVLGVAAMALVSILPQSRRAAAFAAPTVALLGWWACLAAAGAAT
jgi:hypothetical protein